MTASTATAPRWVSARKSFDALVERASTLQLSFDEAAMLRDSHWALGQDARLREDLRFRPTPWGRWMLAVNYLANDFLYVRFQADRRSSAELAAVLSDCTGLVGRRCVLCAADPRFVVDGNRVRLSARELSGEPVLEPVAGPLERYTTHLPVHTLKATAASLPAGEWGGRAQDELIETLGWLKVDLPGRRLNDKMFVARVEGHSMDNGRNRLADGAWAVFELWPGGRKGSDPVLVRGAFHDPETGSYALKKYVADERDAEGRHHRITLVSLNPDKDRYPDIELDPREDDAVTVVARLMQSLPEAGFERRPRPIAHRGRRDWKSDEGVLQVHQRLAESAERFFGATSGAPASDSSPVPSAWSARLVCLDAESGGLHLEIGPLPALWRFVKKLVVCDPTGQTGAALASNVRSRPVTLRVAPAGGPWTWVADGFEDDPDIDLSALTVSGLQHDQANMFRVGADGTGSLVSTRELAVGQHYRLLLHPDVWARVPAGVEAANLPGDWRLLDLRPDPVSASSLQELLEALGLVLGESRADLGFAAATWPQEWRSNSRGEAYACFATGLDVVLQASGCVAEVPGELRLFVYGPSGVQAIDLPVRVASSVRLGGLDKGRYYCSLLHRMTSVPPVHLPFEIVGELSSPPAALFTVRIASETQRLRPGEATTVTCGDLSALEAGAIEVSGPHGWPVEVWWKELGADRLDRLWLDDEGRLDVEALLTLTRERRERRQLGDLALVCAELGTAVLAHERCRKPDAIGRELEQLVAERAGVVAQRVGAFEQLQRLWFEPVCRVLGYELEFVPETPQDPAPAHAVLGRLIVAERTDGNVIPECRRLLVMVESLEIDLPSTLLDWVDRQCHHHRVEIALFTNGLIWAAHRRRSRLPLQVHDLLQALESEDALVDFLRDTAEGV
jgi:hypothetical protein